MKVRGACAKKIGSSANFYIRIHAPVANRGSTFIKKDHAMSSRTISSLLVALPTAILGLGGTTRAAVEVANILFLTSVVLVLIAALMKTNTPVR